YSDDNTEVKFHQGFMMAYFAVRKDLLEAMNTFTGQHVVVTGHSLGGALATIAALDIQYNLGATRDLSFEVYTFGAPRVGNQAMTESYNGRIPDSYRFVYGWDIVTRIPRSWQGYAHVEEAVQIGSRWTWKVLSSRFNDHSIEAYIAGLEAEVQDAAAAPLPG
ncbi:MAG: lipase family protein, partial [Nodosilinea sp.]